MAVMVTVEVAIHMDFQTATGAVVEWIYVLS